MRALALLAGLALLLVIPAVSADDEDPPALPDLDGLPGPDPSGCRPYCDGLPEGPEPTGCRPYCDMLW